MNSPDAFGQTGAHITRDLANLGDDEPSERADYDLERALDDWARATRSQSDDHAGHLRWDTDGRGLNLSLTSAQHDRLTRLLNVDTSLITAHTAATQED